MRTIHCVAFDPDNDYATVGGVDWRVQYEAGEKLYRERVCDPDFDRCRISLFEVRVADWTSNTEITKLADEVAACGDYTAIMRREPKVTA